MNDVIDVAGQVSQTLIELGFDHCFIGGIAIQIWGEPRVTRDVDVTVLTRFDNEGSKIDLLLSRFEARIPHAKEHALKHRVLLCQSPGGIGIDMGLGGFSFEEDVLRRSVLISITDEIEIRVVSPEDLLAMKVFAGRERDWEDVRGILVRQGESLDWALVEQNLPMLLDLIEEPNRFTRLLELRAELSTL